MPSTLDISIEGIPDGSFMTVLDQADGTRIQRGSIVYTDEAMSVTLPIDGGITVKGYVDDSLNPSSNGAYLEGVTVGSVVIFTPLSLFQSGEQGAWYDPSDLSTLFQDAAGTTPVTLDGQPVGLITDKSGNGNNASQPVAAARPTYKTDGTLHWLEFDGVDDYMSHTYSDVSDITLAVAVERLGGIGAQGALTATASSMPIAAMVMANTVNPDWGSFAGGTFQSSGVSILNAKSVLVAIGEPELPSQRLYTNGDLSTTLLGAIYLGDSIDRRRLGAENPTRLLNGTIYAAVMRSGAVSDDDRAGLESYLAGKSGVTL